METLLISEELVSQFKFWMDGKIQTGMRFRRELFRHVSKFKNHQRQEAFDLAWKLAQKDRGVIITASTFQYTVWVNLRSQDELPAEKPLISEVKNQMFSSVTLHNSSSNAKFGSREVLEASLS
jgi:hypothetical protein